MTPPDDLLLMLLAVWLMFAAGVLTGYVVFS